MCANSCALLSPVPKDIHPWSRQQSNYFTAKVAYKCGTRSHCTASFRAFENISYEPKAWQTRLKQNSEILRGVGWNVAQLVERKTRNRGLLRARSEVRIWTRTQSEGLGPSPDSNLRPGTKLFLYPNCSMIVHIVLEKQKTLQLKNKCTGKQKINHYHIASFILWKIGKAYWV